MVTCWVDGRRLEKDCNSSWLKNSRDCLQKCKLTQIWLGEKQILNIWQVEVDFFLDTQKVYNNENFEMSNTWIATKKYSIGLIWVQVNLVYELVTIKELGKINPELLKTTNFFCDLLCQ